MSFSESMTAENGTFTVKGPAGDQVLHRACVVTRTARQTFIGLMCLLYLFPVQFHAQTGRIRNGNFSVLISSGFWVRRQSPSCQIQWVSIAVGLPGAAAPTWVNIARDIEMVVGMAAPGQPQSSQSCATRTAPESVQKCGSASGISTALSITA